MDFGIKGKWALVCGASKGLGFGCAQAMAEEGVNQVIVARNAETLEGAAGKLRAVPGADLVDGRRETIPAGRFGTPEEFGAVFAFLCSRQAGYINGQNILCDGGAYPGTY